MPRSLYPSICNSVRNYQRTRLILGWLLLTLASSALAGERTILVLGDSISAAYGMSLEQGWVALLAAHLEEKNPQSRVVNASISGETTVGGLRRLPTLLEQNQPVLVIIELGANDGLRGYPLGTLRSNLQLLVELSQDSGAAVVLLPMEIPPNYGARYTAGFRDSFVQVAKATNSTLTPFVLDGVVTDAKLMQDDGLHPTIEAQPRLLANILPAVMAVLEQQ